MEDNNKLAMETMETAYAYTDKLIHGIKEFVENKYSMDTSVANERLLMIIEGIDWTIKAITVTDAYRRSPIDIKPMEEVLKEILEAMENQDDTMIADIFEYEFIPLLQKLKENLGCEINYQC